MRTFTHVDKRDFMALAEAWAAQVLVSEVTNTTAARRLRTR